MPAKPLQPERLKSINIRLSSDKEYYSKVLSSSLTVWGWIDTLHACLLVAILPAILLHLFPSLEIILKKNRLGIHGNTKGASLKEGAPQRFNISLFEKMKRVPQGYLSYSKTNWQPLLHQLLLETETNVIFTMLNYFFESVQNNSHEMYRYHRQVWTNSDPLTHPRTRLVCQAMTRAVLWCSLNTTE